MGCEAILKVILSREPLPEPSPAHLPAYQVPEQAGPFAFAEPKDGAGLGGVVLKNLTEAEEARLLFAFEALGAEMTQAVAGEQEVTLARAAEPPQAPSAAKPDRDTELAAIQEIMGYFGAVPSQAVAARRQMILARAAARSAAREGKPAKWA